MRMYCCHMSALLFSLFILGGPGYTHAESQAEYAETARSSWQQQSKRMEESYSRLLSEAEAETNNEPVEQLRIAKTEWEEFRNSFCRSVSKTYGGQWQSVHESECRVKLANQLRETTESYGW